MDTFQRVVGNEYTEELISKRIIHAGFEKIKDFRADNQSISMLDALMSAFAMFSLKDPSLLAFDERRNSDENLKRLYKIKTIPAYFRWNRILRVKSGALPILFGKEEQDWRNSLCSSTLGRRDCALGLCGSGAIGA
jgi:hypothetical protein